MAKYKSYNNTAGRLLGLFSEAAAYSPNSDPSHMMWRKVLKIDPNPQKNLSDRGRMELLKRIMPLEAALIEVEADIKEQRPDDHDIYLKYFPDFWKAVVPRNLDESWASFVPYFADAQLNSLEHCANSLPKDGEITKEEIQEIFAAVGELISQVKGSKINAQLKKWLLEMLVKVRHLIDEYWVRGPKAFRDAMIVMKGESSMHPGSSEEVQEKDAGLFKGLAGLFSKFVDLASKVNGALHLLEYAQPVSDNVPLLSVAVSAAALGAAASKVAGGQEGKSDKK